MMKFNQNQDYFAGCMANEDFILISTYSGLGLVQMDDIFPSYIFNLEVENDLLGMAVLQALHQSRTIHDDKERAEFFNLKRSKQKYDDWVEMLITKFKYKNRKSLFKNMKNCNLWLNNEQIKISPTKQVKLEAWDGEGIKEKDYVYLSVHNTPVEIGQGLKLALERCL